MCTTPTMLPFPLTTSPPEPSDHQQANQVAVNPERTSDVKSGVADRDCSAVVGDKPKIKKTFDPTWLIPIEERDQLRVDLEALLRRQYIDLIDKHESTSRDTEWLLLQFRESQMLNKKPYRACRRLFQDDEFTRPDARVVRQTMKSLEYVGCKMATEQRFNVVIQHKRYVTARLPMLRLIAMLFGIIAPDRLYRSTQAVGGEVGRWR